MKATTACFIRWKDACSEEAADPNTKVPDCPLVELREVGWLIAESEEAVSIAMELEPDGSPSRWRLHIPKTNIIERIDFEVPKRRRRGPKGGSGGSKRSSNGRPIDAVSDRVCARGAGTGVRDDARRDPAGPERNG